MDDKRLDEIVNEQSKSIGKLVKANNAMSNEVLRLSDEIAHLTAENEALKTDLKDACFDGCEDFCKSLCGNEGDLCEGCRHGEFWQWREEEEKSND